MMSGRGKSDSVIVAEKPTNKAGRWTAYDEQQDRGRRRSSPRSCTISALNTSKRRSSNSRRMPHLALTG
jgi:hypothetical protein